MAIAQGHCPNCGAPIQFGLGSSVAKVCEFCQATVLRSDHGFENLGQVARVADVPSLIAVGDEGTLKGRPFRVMGRVQLDHGAGPWDEYYVAFDHGERWGWLAYAQGHWYVTELAPSHPIPAHGQLRLEGDVAIGTAGVFRVAEIKQGTISATEGELPERFPPGFVRYYADLSGQQNAFATLDYGDNSGPPSVFLGWVFAEPDLSVTALGPRSINKVKTTHLRCPNCGGDVPKLSGERAERLGCPYCGAISDIAGQKIIAQQEAALKQPDIPIGSQGTLDGIEYLCIAYVRRGSYFDGEHFSWDEYLLWNQKAGFRWLVKDPESGWSWAGPVNLAEIDLRAFPDHVVWGGRTFALRNRNTARVESVLGEVYWKCEVGETTAVSDFSRGREVLSREEGPGEVKWSYSAPLAWPVIAQAFGLPVDGSGGDVPSGGGAGGSGSGCSSALVMLVIVILVLIVCSSGGFSVIPLGGVSRGGGVSYGGK